MAGITRDFGACVLDPCYKAGAEKAQRKKSLRFPLDFLLLLFLLWPLDDIINVCFVLSLSELLTQLSLSQWFFLTSQYFFSLLQICLENFNHSWLTSLTS